MSNEIINFFEIERQIFGICPNPKCGEFFRLSECKIFLKGEKAKDWLDQLQKQQEKIDRAEEKLEEKRREIMEAAREKGRKQALEVIKTIDRVFTPKGLNPDDAKIIFHPIDYVVFNGMKETKKINNIVLFDRERKDADSKRLQRSIQKTIESGNYEWQTIVIDESGAIKYK